MFRGRRKTEKPEVELAKRISKDFPLETMINTAIEGDAPEILGDQMKSKYSSKNIAVSLISKGNNKNYLVKTKDNSAAFVIQICDSKIQSEHAISILSSENKPEWMPEIYHRVTHEYTPRATRGNNIDETLNTVANKNVSAASYIELCSDSLLNRVETLHQNQKEGEAVELAVNIGGQISQALTTITDKNIVWLDMKVGNILLRENDQIVMADMKGFWPANELVKMYAKGQEEYQIEHKYTEIIDGKSVVQSTMIPVKPDVVLDFESMDITETYNSQAFVLEAMYNTSPNNAKQTIEQEYSHQLGVLLYAIASYQEKVSVKAALYKKEQNRSPDKPSFLPKNYHFNFEHANFQTAAGQRLQSIIERLCAPDLGMRMRHTDAANLLKVINNPAEYEKLNAEVNERIANDKAQWQKTMSQPKEKLRENTAKFEWNMERQSQKAQNSTKPAGNPAKAEAKSPMKRALSFSSTKKLNALMPKSSVKPTESIEQAKTETIKQDKIEEAAVKTKSEKPKLARSLSTKLTSALKGKEPEEKTEFRRKGP